MPFLRTCQLESPHSHLTSKTTLSSSLSVSLLCSHSPWSPASCFWGHPPSFFQKLYLLVTVAMEGGLAWYLRSHAIHNNSSKNKKPLSIFSSHLRKVVVQQLSNKMFVLSWAKDPMASLVAQRLVCLQCRRPGFDPWSGKIPWRRKWQPTPVFLPGESHGWRSLVGCSPRGHKESDTTERLHFTALWGPDQGKCGFGCERVSY